MSIFNPTPATEVAHNTLASQIAAVKVKYQKELDALNARIRELETKLLTTEVKQDFGYEIARRAQQQLESIQGRNKWLEERNATLENPKGSHYTSLSWPGKIMLCIKKMKRPLRFQEVMQELQIMERNHDQDSWLTEKSISVTLCTMAKEKRLHSFKVRGTRGAFYALNEWVDEAGELNEKIRQRMW